MIHDDLRAAGLDIINVSDTRIQLVHDYIVEVESPDLFKLLIDGSVVAPFADRAELVNFILEDMRLNDLR